MLEILEKNVIKLNHSFQRIDISNEIYYKMCLINKSRQQWRQNPFGHAAYPLVQSFEFRLKWKL